MYASVFPEHKNMCIMCKLGARGGQKRGLDLLELELQIVVNHYVGAGNQTWVLSERDAHCRCWAASPAPCSSVTQDLVALADISM